MPTILCCFGALKKQIRKPSGQSRRLNGQSRRLNEQSRKLSGQSRRLNGQNGYGHNSEPQV
jgi:hypothetical protein